MENLPANFLPNGIVTAVHQYDPELAEAFDNAIRDLRAQKEYIKVGFSTQPCYRAHNGSMKPDVFLNTDQAIWLAARDLPEWTVTLVNNGERVIYMDSFRDIAENYTVVYRHKESVIFKVNVYKFIELDWRFVRLGFEWVSPNEFTE